MTDASPARELSRRAQEASGAGHLEEAWALWEQALNLDPRDTDTAIAFTNALAHAGEGRRAAETCARLLEAEPDLAVLWLQHGILLYNHLADPEAAIDSITRSIGLTPHDTIAHRILAQIYFFSFRPTLMRQHATLALIGADPKAELFIRTRYLSDYEGGADLARRILAETPDDIEALVALGKCLRMQGRSEEALPFAARAAELAPLDLEIVARLGDLLLLLGDCSRGWRQMQELTNDAQITRTFPFLTEYLPRRWRGEPLAGKRILVAYSAGRGDNLMMARYARDMRASGAYVAYACRPELLRLLTGLEGADEVMDTWEIPRWGEFDYWVFDYVLPGYLGAAEGNIPARQSGYVTVPADISAHWDSRLGPRRGRLRVGLCWFSGVHIFTGTDRFVPVEDLAPLADLTEVDWFVVQRCGDNPKIKSVFHDNIRDFSDSWYDFADSAAIMQRLDLVISVDSSPLHLAGALGVPAWALICAAPEWRWGLTGEDNAWYPGMRTFRQSRLHDWSDVIARVRAELVRLLASRDQSL
jgi:tetratricopeptide (TPR) repeat protein